MRIDSNKIRDLSVKNMRAIGRAERGGFIASAFALIVGIALLAALGTAGYTSVLRGGAEADGLRGSLGYIRTQVKNHDHVGGISLREGVLVLSEESGESRYELRIFCHEGSLVEEYCEAEAESCPEAAAKLTESLDFQAKFVEPDLLWVATDQGEEYIRLFSAAQGEDRA